MHIVCPHCTTSYAINPAALGVAGRTVRCSRCKETWLARPEDAVEMAAAMPAMAESSPSAGNDAAAEWEAMAGEEEGQDAPVVDSPSISTDWPAEGGSLPTATTATGRRSPARKPRTMRRSGSRAIASG